MTVYRLAKSKYANDLTGKGAELAGGRWNSKGIPMIYTASSRALCMAELAVHLPLGLLPEGFQLITLDIPDTAPMHKVAASYLPKDWNSFPHPHFTQEMGDQFIKEGKYLLMKVPSAAVQGDFNYLINPKHKLISKVKITDVEQFRFDERLFKRGS